MKRVLATLLIVLLPAAGAQAGGSATTAGETAAGTMEQPVGNFSQESNVAKSDLGVKKQDYGGVYDGTAGSNGTFTATGSIQCAAGQQRYIGGVGVFINSCATSGTTVQSINVSVCDKVRDQGTPCTSADYTSSGTATPGQPLALGSDTLTFTCTGLDCGVSVSLQRSMSVTGPSISSQAQQAAQTIGSAGLVDQLTTTINSQSLKNDLTAEADVGTCYNNQVNDLNTTGKISNCAGTYTLSMYQPGSGQSNYCTGANGGVSWEQSCLENQPITVSDCHSTLECVNTENTTQVSCQTGTVQQLVVNPMTCGPIETLPTYLVNAQTITDNAWWGTIYGSVWDNFYDNLGAALSYVLSLGTNTLNAYVAFNQSYALLVNGSYKGIVTDLALDGIFTANNGAYTIDGTAPFVFTNYTPQVVSLYVFLGLYDYGNWPIIDTQKLNVFVNAGDSFQFCTGVCSTLTVQQTAAGATYTCSAANGGGVCPSGFTLNNGRCYENVPVNGCVMGTSTAVTVQGAVSGEIVNYNCNTCGTYQSLAP